MEGNSKTPLLSSTSSANYDSLTDSNNSTSSYSRTRPQPVNRRPFFYPLGHSGSIREDRDLHIAATYNRYRYYTKLTCPTLETFHIPDHIVPPSFYYPFQLSSSDQKESSWLTISTVYNSMMGTSLLCIPYALQQAGLVLSMVILIIMGLVCFYTASLILNVPVILGIHKTVFEFTDVCRQLMGTWAARVSLLFSLSSLLGTAVVYYVLMNNFLYFGGVYVYEYFTHQLVENTTDVLCPVPELVGYVNETESETKVTDEFLRLWKTDFLVPIALVLFLFPLISKKDAKFFTRFNCMASFSVAYLIGFISYNGYQWGLNIDLQNIQSPSYLPLYSNSFPILTGILSLAFYIHNCILALFQYRKDSTKNDRDLAISFTMVGVTYMIIGFVFLLCFPLNKLCIQDNFLNNFHPLNLFAFITRCFLLLQLVALFPLMAFLLRSQFLHSLFDIVHPNNLSTFLFNAVLMLICNLVSIFIPKVGMIIRFSGAFSGLAYIFTLPSLAYMLAKRKKGQLSNFSILFHSFLILIGGVNFVAQFLIS